MPNRSNATSRLNKGKLVSLEDRIPKLKEQRRKKTNKRLIFLLLLFFVLISCIVYFQTPLGHVNKVDIIGNKVYPDETILSKSGISKSTNIWGLDKEVIESTLEDLPEIKAANVKLTFPNNLVIRIEEWERIAYKMEDGKFSLLLENGQVLDKEKIDHVDAPILLHFNDEEVTKKILVELKKIPDEVLNAISEIHYLPIKTNRYHITMYMNDGFEVSASIRTLSEKMVYYPSVVNQVKEKHPNVKGVIDLEVSDSFRPYVLEGNAKKEAVIEEWE